MNKQIHIILYSRRRFHCFTRQPKYIDAIFSHAQGSLLSNDIALQGMEGRLHQPNTRTTSSPALIYFYYQQHRVIENRKMAFLQSLQKQAININKSVVDLVVGEPYVIRAMNEVVTKYGLSIACQLVDITSGGVINIFLPKYISITKAEAEEYNLEKVPIISIIFRGKTNGRNLNIIFFSNGLLVPRKKDHTTNDAYNPISMKAMTNHLATSSTVSEPRKMIGVHGMSNSSISSAGTPSAATTINP
ncbi:hypothetical protein QTP88_020706 [Uroleucon formosanum]